MNDLAKRQPGAGPSPIEEVLGAIREKAALLRYGTITLTLHEGRPTQLEVSEKTRFQA